MLIEKNAQAILSDPDNIESINITAYEPAFGIIGDPAKRKPKTRQSADHSMVYIISTLLRKAIEKKDKIGSEITDLEGLWKKLMLTPYDYSHDAISNPITKKLMEKMDF